MKIDIGVDAYACSTKQMKMAFSCRVPIHTCTRQPETQIVRLSVLLQSVFVTNRSL